MMHKKTPAKEPIVILRTVPYPDTGCRTGEVQEKVQLLQERLQRLEGELEEGMEERSQKYTELRSKEKMITGTILTTIEMEYGI